MAKKTARPAAAQKRPPRLLWANLYCLLDTSSGASLTVRQMLLQLAAEGVEIQILGSTLFDHPKGMSRIKAQWPEVATQRHRIVEIADGALTHQLLVTQHTQSAALTAHEQGLWHHQYLYLLDHFEPDLVCFYGGTPLDLLIPEEARARGIPSAFYLANENYRNERWCRDVDLILTDSQATADMYQASVGFVATPVGKFIDPDQFMAASHERRHLLFINPTWQKGASVVVQLALLLEQQRPEIRLEVVEARADWQALLQEVTQQLGSPRRSLPNVIVTPNTDDMRPIYGRARVLLAPSLWWESSGRVLAEAMLNGIPAIISNRGGMPEMIDDAGIALDFPEACYEKPYKHLLSEEELQPLFDAVVGFYDDQALYDDHVERAHRVGRERHHLSVSTRRLTRALSPLLNQRAGDKDFLRALRQAHKHGLASRTNKPDFAELAAPPVEADANAGRAQTPPNGPLLAPTSAYATDHPDAPWPPTQSVGSQQPTTTETGFDWQPERRVMVIDNRAKPLKQTDFNWSLQGKVVVLDNRAKLLRSGDLTPLLDTQAFSILAFDPASEITEPARYQGRDDLQLFPHALLGDGQPATLHACLDPGMSSPLEPLPAEQLAEHQRQGVRVLTTLPISTIALDSIEGLPNIDWLILDHLSDASTILEHGERALKDTLLIQVRIAFQPTHQRQPTLAELQHWMARHGFRFYRFNDMAYHSHLPARQDLTETQSTELASADVLFLPEPARLAALSDAQRLKLAFLLHSIFNVKDLTYELLNQIDEDKAEQYLLAQAMIIGEPASQQPYQQSFQQPLQQPEPFTKPAAGSASAPASSHADVDDVQDGGNAGNASNAGNDDDNDDEFIFE